MVAGFCQHHLTMVIGPHCVFQYGDCLRISYLLIFQDNCVTWPEWVFVYNRNERVSRHLGNWFRMMLLYSSRPETLPITYVAHSQIVIFCRQGFIQVVS